MKYTKPQITTTQCAAFAIMGGKEAQPVVDSLNQNSTIGAYSADE